MAWTNLEDLLTSNSTMAGTIPGNAKCRVIAGNGTKKKRRKKNLKSALKMLVRKVRRKLCKIDGKKMTLTKFMAKCEQFKDGPEWTFTPLGRFVHYQGPYNKDGEMRWCAVVQLDLRAWLKEQEQETLAKIVKQAFLWRQDGQSMAVKFYENLDLPVPTEHLPQPKVKEQAAEAKPEHTNGTAKTTRKKKDKEKQI